VPGVHAAGGQFVQRAVQQMASRGPSQDEHFMIMIRCGVAPLVALRYHQKLANI
jgi:hypothetical protein